MVVQLCCYFVVSSFVHSLSTHLQIVSADLRSAFEDFMDVRAMVNGTVQTLINDLETKKNEGNTLPASVLNHVDFDHYICTSAGLHRGESDSNHSRISEWETAAIPPDAKS